MQTRKAEIGSSSKAGNILTQNLLLLKSQLATVC